MLKLICNLVIYFLTLLLFVSSITYIGNLDLFIIKKVGLLLLDFAVCCIIIGLLLWRY